MNLSLSNSTILSKISYSNCCIGHILIKILENYEKKTRLWIYNKITQRTKSQLPSRPWQWTVFFLTTLTVSSLTTKRNLTLRNKSIRCVLIQKHVHTQINRCREKHKKRYKIHVCIPCNGEEQRYWVQCLSHPYKEPWNFHKF